MDVSLISTYELGRQPFGLASPAAWLRDAGAAVTLHDIAVADLDDDAIRRAALVGLYVPMHTATRMAAELVPRIRRLNPEAHLCFYGLYAAMNEHFLRSIGGETILGGEFEQGLVDLFRRLEAGDLHFVQPTALVSLDRLRFVTPDRSTLPALADYAHLRDGSETRIVGYTEASRGCKHLCRHCPIVPVYEGRFMVVQPDVVLDDVRQQVAAGARHITFGDPDFFNGPTHAMRIVRALHDEFPDVTYDVTIKVGHLVAHAELLEGLKDTGCAFVTSAVESVDDRVLEKLDKRHTAADLRFVVERCRELGLAFAPTFVAFTPWTTLETYADMLRAVADLGLVAAVSPIQYAIRLLIPKGSRLLELDEIRDLVEPFDEVALAYPWRHPSPIVDELQERVLKQVTAAHEYEHARVAVFDEVRGLAQAALVDAGSDGSILDIEVPDPVTIPYLTEPWYC